jgi:flagellar basal-body rod protein FlgB
VIADKDTSETKPDGNNVGLEDQLLRMGQIQTDFSALTNLYRKQMGLIESALGRTG